MKVSKEVSNPDIHTGVNDYEWVSEKKLRVFPDRKRTEKEKKTGNIGYGRQAWIRLH